MSPLLPPQATDELLKLMSLFVLVHSDTTEQELREIVAFKRQTLQMYLQVGREVSGCRVLSCGVILETCMGRGVCFLCSRPCGFVVIEARIQTLDMNLRVFAPFIERKKRVSSMLNALISSFFPLHGRVLAIFIVHLSSCPNLPACRYLTRRHHGIVFLPPVANTSL